MIVLNPTTVPIRSSAVPKVRFNAKGLISINKAACDVLELQSNDCIQFLFDDKSKTKDLYLEKVSIGFPIRELTAPGSKGMSTNSIGLITKIRELLEINIEGAFAIPCGRELSEFEGKTVLALITRNIQM